ncbi:hypothetical protein DKP78_18280, partial [Enterococcus faecium]
STMFFVMQNSQEFTQKVHDGWCLSSTRHNIVGCFHGLEKKNIYQLPLVHQRFLFFPNYVCMLLSVCFEQASEE